MLQMGIKWENVKLPTLAERYPWSPSPKPDQPSLRLNPWKATCPDGIPGHVLRTWMAQLATVCGHH